MARVVIKKYIGFSINGLVNLVRGFYLSEIFMLFDCCWSIWILVIIGLFFKGVFCPIILVLNLIFVWNEVARREWLNTIMQGRHHPGPTSNGFMLTSTSSNSRINPAFRQLAIYGISGLGNASWMQRKFWRSLGTVWNVLFPRTNSDIIIWNAPCGSSYPYEYTSWFLEPQFNFKDSEESFLRWVTPSIVYFPSATSNGIFIHHL